MNEPAFKDKFIAFVDVLGFKEMIEAADGGAGRSLAEVREILSELGRSKGADFFRRHGPEICPSSKYIARDLDFRVNQGSDSVVMSAEISPAGVVNLIKQCWGAAITLLVKGVMVRGYITRGRIFHEGTEFLGTGFNRAVLAEKQVSAFKRTADEKGTPFIELDSAVCEFVKNETDECVQKMFDRYVRSDGVVTAIFPFQVLSHSFSLGGFGAPPFDPEKEKRNNDALRQSLHRFRDQIVRYVDPTNQSAVRKADHYITALNEQLKICDQTDEMINFLMQPYPNRR